MNKLKLSILDQSIVRKGHTARMALDETIATAQAGDRLGYHRFWVSEHHNSSFIAGSAPELLMVKLADSTSRIRIGSGGIMLPNHSALKVAENFRMLETLFPQRIDLGMGRAPGGDQVTATLLNPANDFSESHYLHQLEQLQLFFRDEAGTRSGPVLAVPQSAGIPAQWILSSSGDSGLIAAKFGMGLAIARFINGFATPDVAGRYRERFQPSGQLPAPHVLLAIAVFCADTEEEAIRMRKFMNFIHLQFERGNFSDYPDEATIQQYKFSPAEEERIRYNNGRIVWGTPDKVKEELTVLARRFEVDEIMATTMTSNADTRKRSFELLAQAFELGSSPG